MRIWIQRIFLPLYITFCEVILCFDLFMPAGAFIGCRHALFLCIILGFLTSCLFINKKKCLITLGLFFTVCADYFLVPCFKNYQNPLLGMAFFCAVQLAYATYLFFVQSHKQKLPHIIARSLASIIGILLPIFIYNYDVDAVSILTGFYLLNFLTNIVFGFLNFKKNPLLAIGLVLFIFCDITTGLYSASTLGYFQLTEGTILYWIANPGFDMTWLFYMPAQVFITLSSILSIKAIYRK